MKCRLLKAKKYAVILEAAGIQLKDGDAIFVKDSIADRMLLQYRNILEDAGSCEKDSLRHGHYEVAGKVDMPSTDKKPKKKSKEDEIKVVEKEESQLKSKEGVATDKSMGTVSGAVKKKKKKVAKKASK